MSTASTLYSARFELPDLLEQGRDNPIQCRLYRAGALVAPASGGTVAVYDDSGTSVAAPTVSVTGNIATATVTSASLASSSRGMGWKIAWSLTVPSSGGSAFVFENDAALVRARLLPPITEADLYRRVKALDPSGTSKIHAQSDFADKLDEAWYIIQRRLINKGNRPNLIMSPSSLTDVHAALTLALIFEDFATRLNDRHVEAAERYRNQYEKAWSELTFSYDEDDDGVPTSTMRRRSSAASGIWVGGFRGHR